MPALIPHAHLQQVLQVGALQQLACVRLPQDVQRLVQRVPAGAMLRLAPDPGRSQYDVPRARPRYRVARSKPHRCWSFGRRDSSFACARATAADSARGAVDTLLCCDRCCTFAALLFAALTAAGLSSCKTRSCTCSSSEHRRVLTALVHNGEQSDREPLAMVSQLHIWTHPLLDTLIQVIQASAVSGCARTQAIQECSRRILTCRWLLQGQGAGVTFAAITHVPDSSWLVGRKAQCMYTCSRLARVASKRTWSTRSYGKLAGFCLPGDVVATALLALCLLFECPADGLPASKRRTSPTWCTHLSSAGGAPPRGKA